MISIISKKLTNLSIAHGFAVEENRDVYIYGYEIALSVSMNVCVCLLISAFFSQLSEGIAFLLTFSILRRCAGGYHAKTHGGCIFAFSCLFTLSLLLLSIFKKNHRVLFGVLICVVAAIILIALAPIDHENKRISAKLYPAVRKKVRGLVASAAVMNIISTIIFNSTISFSISLSLASVCISVIIATFIKYKTQKTGG